jgi:2-isopropylmalate synthase
MNNRPRIIDCTLREGCQTIQCSFSIEQTEILTREIASFGVDMIECGHPKTSDFEVARVSAAVRCSPVPVLAHARCRVEDVDAVVKTGAPWIGLFASFNDISLSTKFKGMTKEEVSQLFEKAIRYAKSKGLKVRATIEDGGRTSLQDLVNLFGIAVNAGADRVCFADSVGMLLPSETFDVLSLLRQEFPTVEMEYHGHNDQGMALANSLEAIRAGILWISTSCNGIGERAGITDTFQLATIMYTRLGVNSFDLKSARRLSELVEVYSRIQRSPMQPVVGQNAFAHIAKLHQLAVLENVLAYSIYDPQLMDSGIHLEKHPPMFEQELFLQPFEKSSLELKYHRHGPGKRFVMIDHRLLKASPYYVIARKVCDVDSAEPAHVDSHRHNCDSLFMFLGDEDDYEGLEVEVSVMGNTRNLTSPATVFVPAGAPHTYRFLKGSGTFINFVERGEYSQSLLELKKEF